MLLVESIGVIRQARKVHKKSIRGIAGSMGVSRNTVRKAVRSKKS